MHGHTRSCGCLTAENNYKHGMANTKEWNTWVKVISRCTNPKCKNFKDYGGRGIKVCDEWLNSFEAFFEHIGYCPNPQMSIDRIDNEGHYEPGNVRWATKKQQNRNTRKTTKVILNGIAEPLADLCERLNVDHELVRHRFLKYGWTLGESLFTPPKRYRPRAVHAKPE